MEAVKTIIITGGGGHLGRSVARWWAKPGTQVVLIDRDAERLDKSRADLIHAWCKSHVDRSRCHGAL